MSFEANFDGLVGPTHNYAGLSHGNVASMKHGGLASNPREAALQGLAKMRKLHGMGLRQAFLPPLERPSIPALRRFGFGGSDAEVLMSAAREAPHLLGPACSASCMWTANAATVTPATDSADGRVHFTPANLVYNLHRSLEPQEVGANLRRIFPEGDCFAHHPALPGGSSLGDEGAANHTRHAIAHGEPGMHVFAYGFEAYDKTAPRPKNFAARQSLEASQCVARLNEVAPSRCLFVQQNPAAIDAGVFHNDVIATGNERVLLYHDQAFLNGEADIDRMRELFGRVCGGELVVIRAPSESVSLADAVGSYLFNSQVVTLPDGKMAIISPEECRENEAVHRFIQSMVADAANPISDAIFMDLRASMANGGGPACLRLRVVLDDDAWSHVADGVKIDEANLSRLEQWVRRHYREELRAEDLADPGFLQECYAALDELTQIINLPGLYAFQR